MLKNKIVGAFRLLYKNIIAILLAGTICVVLSVGYAVFNQSAVYTASAEVIVHNGDLGTTVSASGENAVSFIPSVERIFNSPALFRHFKEQFMLDSSYTAEELSEMITVKAEGKSSPFMKVSITADTADEAVRIAGSFCSCLSDYIRFVSSSISVAVISTDSEAVLERANIPAVAVAGFLGGTVAVSLFILIFGGGNRRLLDAADYKAKYSLPLIGTVPDFESKGGK